MPLETRTKQTLCKPTEEQNPRLMSALSAVYPRDAAALRSWLLTNVPPRICLCKPVMQGNSGDIQMGDFYRSPHRSLWSSFLQRIHAGFCGLGIKCFAGPLPPCLKPTCSVYRNFFFANSFGLWTQPSPRISLASAVLFPCGWIRTPKNSSNTCPVQNPDIPRAGRTRRRTAERRGGTGSGRTGTPTGRFTQKTTVPFALGHRKTLSLSWMNLRKHEQAKS